jgi:hypothetical protein
LERVGSQYINHLATLPDNALMEASKLPAVDQENYLSSKHDNNFLSGGGIGDFFKKAVSFIKDVAPKAKKAVEIGKQVYDIGKDVKELAGLGRPKRRMVGGADLIYGADLRPARGNMYYD